MPTATLGGELGDDAHDLRARMDRFDELTGVSRAGSPVDIALSPLALRGSGLELVPVGGDQARRTGLRGHSPNVAAFSGAAVIRRTMPPMGRAIWN